MDRKRGYANVDDRAQSGVPNWNASSAIRRFVSNFDLQHPNHSQTFINFTWLLSVRTLRKLKSTPSPKDRWGHFIQETEGEAEPLHRVQYLPPPGAPTPGHEDWVVRPAFHPPRRGQLIVGRFSSRHNLVTGHRTSRAPEGSDRFLDTFHHRSGGKWETWILSMVPPCQRLNVRLSRHPCAFWRPDSTSPAKRNLRHGDFLQKPI